MKSFLMFFFLSVSSFSFAAQELEHDIDTSLEKYQWSQSLIDMLETMLPMENEHYYQRWLVVRSLEKATLLSVPNTLDCVIGDNAWYKKYHTCYVGTSEQDTLLLQLLQRPDIQCYLQQQDMNTLLHVEDSTVNSYTSARCKST